MVQRKLSMFDAVVYAIMALVLVLTAYPLLFSIIASFSRADYVLRGEAWLIPRGFNTKAYQNVFANNSIWSGYYNSLFYTTIGTVVNLAVNVPCAYALSKKSLLGRNTLMLLFTFTMYFSGGMIPTYLLMKNLGVIDTRLALTICFPLNVYNMIVARTYYSTSISEEIYESCRIDGANDYTIFLRIALPLSKPILAVLTLYFAMGHWNSYFNALIYINRQELYPLQLVLRNILILNEQMTFSDTMSGQDMLVMAERQNIVEAMKYALIFFASAPVLIIYPFLQKHFVKGVMIGAIKG